MSIAARVSFPTVNSSASMSQSAPWLLTMVLFWGLSWPAMKLALGMTPPLWLATFRFASGAACLFALAALRGTIRLPPRADWPVVASIGGLQMMAFTALGLTAMQYTDAGRAAVLAYTTPLWGVLAAWIMFRQRPTAWQGLALGVGMAGVAMICSPLEMDWTRPGVIMGNGFLLMAAICWSLVILHVRRHQFISRPIDLAPWQMLCAAIPLGVAALAFEGMPTQVECTPRLAGLLAFIGPVATSACFVISTEHGRRISTFTMSNITMGVPIIGVLASALLLGERISAPLAGGLGLIVAGAGLAALAVRRKAAADAATAERSGRQKQDCALV
jgi:drug/metabolite transporter (DMT)-like permease